jgi:hypothetical protein
MPKQTSYLRKGAEAPAILLDRTVLTTEALAARMPKNRLAKEAKDYWHMLGPGLTTGASDDDPQRTARPAPSRDSIFYG